MTQNMADAQNKTKRNGVNLYLPPELVKSATVHAESKHGLSLSKMVERQLTKLQRKHLKKAA